MTVVHYLACWSVQVWFRQGVNGDKLFWDAKAATGTAWVLMVGEMDHIAVSPNDQVVIVWVCVCMCPKNAKECNTCTCIAALPISQVELVGVWA
jgi:hypothetical protein